MPISPTNIGKHSRFVDIELNQPRTSNVDDSTQATFVAQILHQFQAGYHLSGFYEFGWQGLVG